MGAKEAIIKAKKDIEIQKGKNINSIMTTAGVSVKKAKPNANPARYPLTDATIE